METQAEYESQDDLDKGAKEALRSMAIAAGFYYQALLDADVPPDVSAQLVKDWSYVQWDKALR